MEKPLYVNLLVEKCNTFLRNLGNVSSFITLSNPVKKEWLTVTYGRTI